MPATKISYQVNTYSNRVTMTFMKSDFQRQVIPNPSSYSIAHKLNLLMDNYPFQLSGHSHTSDQFDDIQLWRCSCFCKHHGFETSRRRGRNLFQSQVE